MRSSYPSTVLCSIEIRSDASSAFRVHITATGEFVRAVMELLICLLCCHNGDPLSTGGEPRGVRQSFAHWGFDVGKAAIARGLDARASAVLAPGGTGWHRERAYCRLLQNFDANPESRFVKSQVRKVIGRCASGKRVYAIRPYTTRNVQSRPGLFTNPGAANKRTRDRCRCTT